ncbi:MAG: hypothetical protein HQL45_11105 [Alphaproteobacteria bacterium]|nr:hypothetical protein [Alphaproteobacteria bacterium]
MARRGPPEHVGDIGAARIAIVLDMIFEGGKDAAEIRRLVDDSRPVVVHEAFLADVAVFVIGDQIGIDGCAQQSTAQGHGIFGMLLGKIGEEGICLALVVAVHRQQIASEAG